MVLDVEYLRNVEQIWYLEWSSKSFRFIHPQAPSPTVVHASAHEFFFNQMAEDDKKTENKIIVKLIILMKLVMDLVTTKISLGHQYSTAPT